MTRPDTLDGASAPLPGPAGAAPPGTAGEPGDAAVAVDQPGDGAPADGAVRPAAAADDDEYLPL